MAISETPVRPTDGAVEHPRMDLLRVVEQMPWLACKSEQKTLVLNNHSSTDKFY